MVESTNPEQEEKEIECPVDEDVDEDGWGSENEVIDDYGGEEAMLEKKISE